MKKFFAGFMLWYLRFWAKIQLFKIRPQTIGIGGASGKSSLANFVGIILREKYKVLETKGKNSETGIPLSILNIDIPNYSYLDWTKAFFLSPLRVLSDWEKYEFLVAEMGIDGPFEPKNMTYLLKIVKPKIGVLTNISFEHSVYFEEISRNKEKILELTAKEESLLLRSLPKGGTAILNIDDSKIREIKGIKASKISVSGKDVASDFFIEKVETNLKSFRVSFFFKAKEYKIELRTPLPDHYSHSLVLAIALCFSLGFKISDSIENLERKFSLPSGRMSVFEGKNGTTILDSSYNNATLSPIIDILDLLKRISGERRRVAILGDMRELGVISKTYHEKVAKKILESTDLVFLIGPLMRKFVAPVLLKSKHKFYSFNTFSESKNEIKKNIKKNDVILVKSSQNTLFLERAVEMLLKDPKDRKRLARRGNFWDKVRSKNL